MAAVRSGEHYGRLTVLYRIVMHPRLTRAIVRCDCGVTKAVAQSQLLGGHTLSCGCLRRENFVARVTTHGATKSRAFTSWRGMWQRCTNAKHKDYAIYGGRGITVCERWKDFAAFLIDMGHRPDGMTLDRFPDKDGDYEPNNCRWATVAQQTRNKRSNVIIEHGGHRLTVADWARKLGVKENTLYNRLNEYGWSAERALGLPGAHLVEARA